MFINTPGGSFILDTDPEPTALWGKDDQVLQAHGEALIIAARRPRQRAALERSVEAAVKDLIRVQAFVDLKVGVGMIRENAQTGPEIEARFARQSLRGAMLVHRGRPA